jgi:hypothetical protein
MYMSADCHIMELDDLFTRHPSAVEPFRPPIFRRLPDGAKIVFSTSRHAERNLSGVRSTGGDTAR